MTTARGQQLTTYRDKRGPGGSHSNIGAPGSMVRAQAEGHLAAGTVEEFRRMRTALEEVLETVRLWASADNQAGRIADIACDGLGVARITRRA